MPGVKLDVGFKAITFGSYGFGKGSHQLISKVTANASSSVYDPWVKPGPKGSHAYLVFGFALARANARMLLNADANDEA